MLVGTECVQISKQQVRVHILSILDTLFHAQVALAAKDKESERAAAKNRVDYKSLCYWDARERIDPFVEYVAGIVVELTTGWFWPDAEDDLDVIACGEHGVPCGFATYYHKEIATKILEYADDIREYYEGTPLEGTWMKFDRQIRGSVAAYRKLVEGGGRYSYGLVKKIKKENDNAKEEQGDG